MTSSIMLESHGYDLYEVDLSRFVDALASRDLSLGQYCGVSFAKSVAGFRPHVFQIQFWMIRQGISPVGFAQGAATKDGLQRSGHLLQLVGLWCEGIWHLYGSDLGSTAPGQNFRPSDPVSCIGARGCRFRVNSGSTLDQTFLIAFGC